ARIEGRLEDAGFAINERFRLPSTVSGITPAVHDVLLKVEELRFQRGLDRFVLIHHRPSNPSGSKPDKVQLLPIDREWLRRLAERPWPTRSIPMYTIGWRELFSALM